MATENQVVETIEELVEGAVEEEVVPIEEAVEDSLENEGEATVEVATSVAPTEVNVEEVSPSPEIVTSTSEETIASPEITTTKTAMVSQVVEKDLEDRVEETDHVEPISSPELA